MVLILHQIMVVAVAVGHLLLVELVLLLLVQMVVLEQHLLCRVLA
jgi:hypothetical protein